MSRQAAPLTPDELCSRVVITVPEYAATFCADERTVVATSKKAGSKHCGSAQPGESWSLRYCGNAGSLRQRPRRRRDVCGLRRRAVMQFETARSAGTAPLDRGAARKSLTD